MTEQERLCCDFLHLRPQTKLFFKARVKSVIHLNHLRNKKHTKATKTKLSLRMMLPWFKYSTVRFIALGLPCSEDSKPPTSLCECRDNRFGMWSRGRSRHAHMNTHTNITHTRTRTHHDPVDRRSKQAGRTPGACESKLNFGAAS